MTGIVGSSYRLDPWQWCADNKTEEGRVPVGGLMRLLPMLVQPDGEPDGEAAYRFTFERLDGRHLVRGRVESVLQVNCERCLEPMTLSLDVPVAIAFVRGTDEAKRLPDSLDPYVVEEQTIDLRTLVEDELILAIPVVPRHDLRACPVKLESSSGDALNEHTDSPFAVLAGLRGKG